MNRNSKIKEESVESTPVNDHESEVNRPPQKLEKQLSESSASQMAVKLKNLTSSPVVVRRRRSKETTPDNSRISKTLPRGLGCGASIISNASTSSSQSSQSDTCDVYGLYGRLMYVKDCYNGEDRGLITDHPEYETLRRSDPELAAIPAKVTTLDRRLRMKIGRPRLVIEYK